MLYTGSAIEQCLINADRSVKNQSGKISQIMPIMQKFHKSIQIFYINEIFGLPDHIVR